MTLHSPRDMTPSPDPKPLREVKRLLKKKEWALALERLEGLPPALARRPAALACLARAQAGQGRIEAAHATLDRAKGKAGDRMNLLKLRRQLHMRSRNLEGLSETLRRMTARAPDRIGPVLQLSRTELDLGRVAAAETAAREALRIDPGSPRAFEALHAAVLRSGDATRLPGIIRDSLSAATACPRFTGLHGLFSSLPRHESQALQEALERRWPEQQAHSPARVPRAAIQLALEGQAEAALRLTGPLREAAPRDIPLARFEELVPCIPGPERRQREIVRDDDTELLVSAPSSRGVTALFFTGLQGEAMAPIEVVDAFCASADVAGVYLRDVSSRFFLGGVGALGPDRQSTQIALQDLLTQLGTRRLLVFGISGGSLGAIRYGIDLQANRIIGLAAATVVTPEGMARLGDARLPVLIQRLSGSFAPAELDVRPHVERAQLRDGLALWYGANHALDAAHAAHLGDLPGVSLHPIPGLEGHAILPALMRSGAFEALLREEAPELA